MALGALRLSARLPGLGVALALGALSRLVAALAKSSAEALGAAWGFAALAEEETLSRALGFEAGPAREVAAPPPALEVLGWVVERRRPFFTNDLLWKLPRSGQSLAQVGWRGLLAVPLLNHQGRALGGILVVDRRSAAGFGELELGTATAFGLAATVGLERALLLERLEDWTRGLEALLAFSAAVNRHLDPPALVRHLVEHAARFLKASGGLAGLAVEDAGGAPCFAAEAYWHAGRWHAEPRSFGQGEGLAGFVLETEFPYLANDYPTDRLADAGLAERYDVARALCVPIKDSEERLLGFFELHRSREQPPFSWQDAAFVESLANTTTVAIENARLLDALEAKNREIRTLSAHNVARLEEERAHIARELHDEAGQALVGVKLALQVMARLAPSEPPTLREQLDALRDQVHEATAQIKELARRLRPPSLDHLGLEVALRQLATEYQHRTGITVEVELPSFAERAEGLPPAKLPASVETALYRVAQEALTNVAAHAEAGKVRLALRLGPVLALSVEDDGRGFDPAAAHSGLGLLGIRERLAMLGGRLELVSALGEGTRLRVTLPLEATGA